MVLGQRWTVAQSQQGNQNVVRRPRCYRKPGILLGGVVEGQAIITATYRGGP
ncbi:TPA: hypothetical protein QDZ60_003398, partial [Stenotrophomonas maltophilia]|nr:hypothetical protein [Stenotrophomonas maltophilia]